MSEYFEKPTYAQDSLHKRPVLLVLTSTYPRWLGDPEPGFVHELSKRLTDQFHVIVLGPHAPGALPVEVMDGVEVVRYRYAPQRWETLVNNGGIVTNLRNHRWKAVLVPGFVLLQAWTAWRLCRSREVDVIHAHWLVPQGLIAALLQFMPGRAAPYVVTSHGADLYALPGRWLEKTKRFVIRKASWVTAVSSAMRGTIDLIGGDVSKVSVLSMGVDVEDRFFPDDAHERSTIELLFVGRLVEKKGLNYLLLALPEILRQRPDVRLTIAGFGPDESRLKQLADSLGLLPAVEFLGAMPQAELPGLYRRAALFVAPFIQADSGDQEGLPVALMEAISCGCPILAGDVPGLHDMLGEHAADVVFDPRDEASLVARVLASLEDRQGGLERALLMSDYVRNQFNWDRLAAAYSQTLVSAVGSGPAKA